MLGASNPLLLSNYRLSSAKSEKVSFCNMRLFADLTGHVDIEVLSEGTTMYDNPLHVSIPICKCHYLEQANRVQLEDLLSTQMRSREEGIIHKANLMGGIVTQFDSIRKGGIVEEGTYQNMFADLTKWLAQTSVELEEVKLPPNVRVCIHTHLYIYQSIYTDIYRRMWQK